MFVSLGALGLEAGLTDKYDSRLGQTAKPRTRGSLRGQTAAEVKLTLVPRRRMGVDLEQWAIEKDSTYFREVFGRELSTAVS